MRHFPARSEQTQFQSIPAIAAGAIRRAAPGPGGRATFDIAGGAPAAVAELAHAEVRHA